MSVIIPRMSAKVVQYNKFLETEIFNFRQHGIGIVKPPGAVNLKPMTNKFYNTTTAFINNSLYVSDVNIHTVLLKVRETTALLREVRRTPSSIDFLT